jgi:ribosomal protein S25
MHMKKKKKKDEKKTVDTMQTPYARVCELTVTVFASDIEKMRCVCVCATVQRIYLSI